MKKLMTICVMALLGGLLVDAQTAGPASAPSSGPTVRFAWLDVYIDSKARPLAAYQFELKATGPDVRIVGIQGGEHLAFKDPPFYDPAALSHNRVIIAAYNTGNDLPVGKTHVARLHVRMVGVQRPEYIINVMVAGTTDGAKIPVVASVTEGVGP
jgi:hypothetical protein